MPKPSLILLHGSHHSAAIWERVVPILESRGYKCTAPQVCFCGTEKPLTSIFPCISQIQSVIAEEVSAGMDVVMVHHSFGGVIGCSAVKGYTAKEPSNLPRAGSGTGKVVGIVQLASFTVPSDTSLLSYMKSLEIDFKPIGKAGPDGWEQLLVDPVSTFYNDMDPEDAKYWAGKLLRHSSATRVSNEGVYAGWKDVPVCYVVCTKDNAMPAVAAEAMLAHVREANSSVVVKELEADHSPMLSRPKETANVVEEAVKSFVARSVKNELN